MSDTKWTQGDWFLEAGEIKASCCPIELAKVTTFNEGKANGQLMAAAPKLYEALDKMLHQLSINDEEGLFEHADIVIDARAALAKARGK